MAKKKPRPRRRSRASSALTDLKHASTKLDSLSEEDEKIVQISAKVRSPSYVKSMAATLGTHEKSTWTPKEFGDITGAESAAGLIHSSVFVRAAARLGSVYFIGSDRHIYRHAVSAKRAAPTVIDATAAEDYFVKPEWYNDLKSFIEDDAPTLLIGPPGTGKTETCEQVFKELGQTLQVIPCTPSMTADDLEGHVDLRNDGGVSITEFEPALLAIASEAGHGVLLDEADAIPAQASFGLFRLLAGKEMRIQRMGARGIIPRHEDFRIVGTQNTEGRGDDQGLHHGRAYQDEAWLDRWENVIRVDYFPKEVEVDILVKKTGVDEADAEQIVDGATLLRRALAEDAIMFCCTMRRTLAVAKNIVRGYHSQYAWAYAVVNRATREDSKEMLNVLGRVYGSSWKL